MPKGHYAQPQRLVQILHEGKLTTLNYGRKKGSLRKQVELKKEEYPGASVVTPVDYAGIQHERLNDVDRVARLILAIVYSGTKSANFVTQQLIGMSTVAVASHNGTYYVASNALQLTSERVKSALEVGQISGGVKVVEHGAPDTDYHAEMQLADYFFHLDMRMDNDEIGVSKPCCMLCAERLDKLGITYSYWHDQGVGQNWIPCSASQAWW